MKRRGGDAEREDSINRKLVTAGYGGFFFAPEAEPYVADAVGLARADLEIGLPELERGIWRFPKKGQRNALQL